MADHASAELTPRLATRSGLPATSSTATSVVRSVPTTKNQRTLRVVSGISNVGRHDGFRFQFFPWQETIPAGAHRWRIRRYGVFKRDEGCTGSTPRYRHGPSGPPSDDLECQVVSRAKGYPRV
jgi:hypothetical protein